jgi:hypothetical protein
MELRQLPPFLLERRFSEFEFVVGMRNLVASGPFAVTTRELRRLDDHVSSIVRRVSDVLTT